MRRQYKTFKISALLADPTIADGWELRVDDSRDGWWQMAGITQPRASEARIEFRHEHIRFEQNHWTGATIKARSLPAARMSYTDAQVIDTIAHGSIITVRPQYGAPFKIEVLKPADGFMIPIVFPRPGAISLHGRKMTTAGRYSRRTARERAGLTSPMLVHSADITHIAAPST